MASQVREYCRLAIVCFLLSATAPAQRQVALHADSTRGPVALRLGTNAGPRAMGTVRDDYTPFFRAWGITSIRTHDYYGPCDWMTIFPRWDADPMLASSYDFASSDEAVQQIIDAGFEVYFRLGSSWRGNNPLFTNDPPGTIRDASGTVTHVADTTDFRKFAEICRHIVMHYREGWAGGKNLAIRHWEIWNEPSGREQFWSGTPLQFQQLFAIVATTLKAHDHTLIVGGPGQAGHTSPGYFENLLSYCRRNGVPLDFYSWHSYGDLQSAATPWELGKKALDARRVLDLNGYSAAEQHCTEWNAGVNQNNFANSGRGAAFYAATLTYLAQYGVTESHQYRADNHPLGLILQNGSAKRAADVFITWRRLTGGTSVIRSDGSDTLGFTVLGTRSGTGDTIRCLLANFPSDETDVVINTAGLPAGRERWAVVVYGIDDARGLSRVDSFTTTRSSLVSLSLRMPAQSVRYLQFSPEPPTGIADPSATTATELVVFPQPAFRDGVHATYRRTHPGAAVLRLTDLLGRVVSSRDIDASSLEGTVFIETRSLAGGTYIVEYAGPGGITRRLVCTR